MTEAMLHLFTLNSLNVSSHQWTCDWRVGMATLGTLSKRLQEVIRQCGGLSCTGRWCVLFEAPFVLCTERRKLTRQSSPRCRIAAAALVLA